MRKVYNKDWQENVGYEDYSNKQSDELQSKHKKVVKNYPRKPKSVSTGRNIKTFAQQQA